MARTDKGHAKTRALLVSAGAEKIAILWHRRRESSLSSDSLLRSATRYSILTALVCTIRRMLRPQPCFQDFPPVLVELCTFLSILLLFQMASFTSFCLERRFFYTPTATPVMPPAKSMTANPVKAPRYRAGKPTGVDSESESDNVPEDEEEAPKKPPTRKAPAPKFANAAGPGRIISRGNDGKINLKAAGIGSNAQDNGEEEKKRREAAAKARIAAEQKAREEGFVTEEEDEEEEESGSEEEESEEEESSEEEEAPRRLMLRPKFIRKADREAGVTASNSASTNKKSTPEEDEAAAEEARRRAADELVEEQIKKDLAARAAGKKHWDDDTDPEDDQVDDTDDIDPEAEYAAWKLRELKRVRREREAIEAKEKELAEIERRRNLTEEERRAEDEKHLQQQKGEKEGKGKMAYMQKYFHKGAFYQDESKEMGLDKRDIMGTRFADDVKNRELLPKALQLRDMTKLGRKGATKYRDLKSEDTGQWGRLHDNRPGREFDRFGDERFQPDDSHRDRYRDRGGDGPKGSNAIPLGDRKSAPERSRGEDRYRGGDRDRNRDRDRSRDRHRDRDGDRDRHRDRDSDRDGDRRRDDDYRERRRSPSPSRDRDRDHGERRKRSPSRERDRYESDKRRKVDTR
ncbi:splicing factor, Prp19-binding domain-containing protein [Neurospora intermedia]|uniref:Splicing factor, Prp19-binding domain-containing protein n=1 Tax=Neurospora intermedia TaxID=5142 RepID=A0ABR3D2H7_NEUIN